MDNIITKLARLLEEKRHADPNESYVAQLHQQGLDKILDKISEEANETILAAREASITGNPNELVKETADLWFHSMVMLQHIGTSPDNVLTELGRRFGTSGLVEKASRISSEDPLREK